MVRSPAAPPLHGCQQPPDQPRSAVHAYISGLKTQDQCQSPSSQAWLAYEQGGGPAVRSRCHARGAPSCEEVSRWGLAWFRSTAHAMSGTPLQAAVSSHCNHTPSRPRVREQVRVRCDPNCLDTDVQEPDSGTADTYSNLSAQHRSHPTDGDLRVAPTTGIDFHATRSHRGGQVSRRDTSVYGPSARPELPSAV